MRPTISTLRHALPLALGPLLVVSPAGAQESPEAQEPADAPDPRCVCIEADGPSFFSPGVMRLDRARIGVVLGDAVDVDGRTGARVRDVVDGGPADDAGLREADVIVALNDADLGDDPSAALVDAMADIDPGDTVTVTYYRDGERHTAEMVTEEAGDMELFTGPGSLRVRLAPHMDLPRLRERPGAPAAGVVSPRTWLRRLSPGGLELVELNPGLGEYFGTDEGVLVADLDDDGLGLQPGDVIVAIDGRRVRDAAHVRAILDSYRADEQITFDIVRRKRPMEVTGTTG